MRRDFTYVDDLVEAVMRLMATPPVVGQPVGAMDSLSPVAPWRVVNIAGGQPVELMRFIAVIEEALGEDGGEADAADAGGGCDADGGETRRCSMRWSGRSSGRRSRTVLRRLSRGIGVSIGANACQSVILPRGQCDGGGGPSAGRWRRRPQATGASGRPLHHASHGPPPRCHGRGSPTATAVFIMSAATP